MRAENLARHCRPAPLQRPAVLLGCQTTFQVGRIGPAPLDRRLESKPEPRTNSQRHFKLTFTRFYSGLGRCTTVSSGQEARERRTTRLRSMRLFAAVGRVPLGIERPGRTRLQFTRKSPNAQSSRYMVGIGSPEAMNKRQSRVIIEIPPKRSAFRAKGARKPDLSESSPNAYCRAKYNLP